MRRVFHWRVGEGTGPLYDWIRDVWRRDREVEVYTLEHAIPPADVEGRARHTIGNPAGKNDSAVAKEIIAHSKSLLDAQGHGASRTSMRRPTGVLNQRGAGRRSCGIAQSDVKGRGRVVSRYETDRLKIHTRLSISTTVSSTERIREFECQAGLRRGRKP